MSIWVWIAVAAVVLIAIPATIVAVGMLGTRRKTHRLKQHYGGEYERLVSDTGSEKAANRELTSRQRKRDKLDIVALTPSALSDFRTRWQQVQNAFVDDPAAAVGVADRLITEVMCQRGYPVRDFDDFDQRVADLSVDHPHVVENYRAAHSVHSAEQHASTEQQREAFVHYRALFETLLDSPTNNDAAHEASA